MPISTAHRNPSQSITEIGDDRTKSHDDVGVLACPAGGGSIGTHGRFHGGRGRVAVLLLVLGCLFAVFCRMTGDSSPIWQDHVRVSSLASFDALPLAHGSASKSGVHRAGWVWDAIEVLEEYLESDPDTSDAEESDEEGEGEGEDGEGENEGEDGQDSEAGDEGGDAGGDGEAGDGDGEPEQTGGDADQSDRSVVVEYVVAYFDEDEEFLNSLSDEELTLLLFDILDILYEYAEQNSMTH